MSELFSSHGIQIGVDKRDMLRLQVAMAKLVRYSSKSMEDSLLMGAHYVAHAAASATKTSPKVRKIIDNPDRDAYRRSDGSADSRRAAFAAVQWWGDGNVHFRPIRAASKAEAQTKKAAQIGRRGLAKRAWQWSLAKIGGRVRGGPVGTSFGEWLAQQHAVGEKHLERITDQHIVLGSRLHYAGLAFKTKGKATVLNIIQRAGNKMQHEVERKLGKVGRHI